MEKKIIIGIDPGIEHGAIAILDESGDVIECTKMLPTILDIYSFFCDTMEKANIEKEQCVAYLEDVGHGMPGQSSSATAKFARHNGHLEMALCAAHIKTIKVLPNKWQRALGVKPKQKEETKIQYKNRLKSLSQQLFPNIKITLNNADALLIAEYGRIQEK